MVFSHLVTHGLCAFLLGLLAHSLFPYAHLPHAWLVALAIIIVFCIVIIPSERGAWRQSCGLLLLFALGIHRFSLAQPHLPRGLVFASPRGLAITAPMSRTANHLDPRHWLFRARTSLKARAQSRFSANQAALLTGILYGERELSKEAKTAFRHAGLLHIIAVSGSNMTIIVVIAMRLFLALRFSRRQSFLATTCAIITFTLFVGPSASVVRAAFTGILVELAPLVGRLVRSTRLLLIAACLFTLWRPWALAFDPSFALSFLAMIGLLTYGHQWNEKLTPYIHSNILRETITSTAAATLLTTPYAAWAFGSVTFWGIATNILILPLIPWTMLLGCLALLVPQTLIWLTLPAQGCLEIVLRIANLAHTAQIGYLDRAFLPFSWLVASYLILFLSTPRHQSSPLSARSNNRKEQETARLTEASLYDA